MPKLKYGELCAGIAASTVAWHPLGWEVQWFSQYDPEHNYEKNGLDFPSSVLNHHYPTVPNLGDMTKIIENETFRSKPVDVIVGGTPCQGFSIAGLRGGLLDYRSNLSLEFVRILIEKQPEWFVWENVPGCLTTGTGDENEEDAEESGSASDFACLLSAFTGRDIAAQEFTKAGIIEGEFYSVAWRILDSQYFGVPQRRRRIFVVGHLGKDWRPPVAVLLESESLQRDFTPRTKKRKGTAGNSKNSTRGSGQPDNGGYRMLRFGEYVDDGTSSTLKKRDYKDATDLVVQCASIDCRNDVVNDEISGTLQSKENGGYSLNYINPAIITEERHTAYGIISNIVDRDVKNGGNGMGIKEEQAPTLTKADRHAVAHIVFDTTQVTSKENRSNPQIGDPCHTLGAGSRPSLLVVSEAKSFYPSHYTRGFGQHGISDTAGTLKKTNDDNSTHVVYSNHKTIIRRLTPTECLRLQGFPDDYLDIEDATDSKKYCAIGNSMTTHVMHWIGSRIDKITDIMRNLKEVTTAERSVAPVADRLKKDDLQK